MRRDSFQNKLEISTGHWWFFILVLVWQAVAVPYASRNFSFSNWAGICSDTLAHAFISHLRAWNTMFKILPLLLFGLALFQRRAGRLFSLFAGLSYVMFAVVQNVAISPRYGFSFITVNVGMFLLVALSWFQEVRAGQTVYSFRGLPLWRYWVVVPALFAFWAPGNPHTGALDFGLGTLLGNDAGMAFCLMTPFYLAILSLCHPRVNRVTMRVTSLIGLILGLYNLFFIFLMKTAPVLAGVIHLPLVIVPVYTLILAYRQPRSPVAGVPSATEADRP